jgi:hypothetical protein
MPDNATGTQTPGRCWASWALTARPERCSVRPSGPKRLRGRPIPVRPCAFADRAQPPRAWGATGSPAARPLCRPCSSESTDSQARAGAAMGFWALRMPLKMRLETSPPHVVLEKLPVWQVAASPASSCLRLRLRVTLDRARHAAHFLGARNIHYLAYP